MLKGMSIAMGMFEVFLRVKSSSSSSPSLLFPLKPNLRWAVLISGSNASRDGSKMIPLVTFQYIYIGIYIYIIILHNHMIAKHVMTAYNTVEKREQGL